MATSSSNDPSTYAAGTTPTGSEQVLANQSGSLVSLTTAQLTQLSYNSLALWKTYDTVAQMKAGASAAYPRVKWRGYFAAGDGGGGEGLYSATSATADEGAIFATTAGGYVTRDFPPGDICTSMFGMTTGLGNNDAAPALQAALTYAASVGRACHINGRASDFIYVTSVNSAGCRVIYGDGAKVDAHFGTSLIFQPDPSTITDLMAGFHLVGQNTVLRDITLRSNDTSSGGWGSNVQASTLISSGLLTLPSNFVAHTDTLPWTAFRAGIAALSVDDKCNLYNVETSGGKIGAIMNSSGGHILADHCNFNGGMVGRFWLRNEQDHFIIGGGSAGFFAGEGMTEDAFGGEVYRLHQYHIPYGWYQFSYHGGSVNGMFLDATNLSVEHMTESWIYMSSTANGNRIKVESGGDLYGYPVAETDSYNLSTRLPDAYFANSLRNYYSSGRFGTLSYWKTNAMPNGPILATGGAGTYSHRVSSFGQNMGDSDLTVIGSLDYSAVTGTTYYQASQPLSRTVYALADRSDPAAKSRMPQLGNLLLGSNAYSSSMGLGVPNNCLVSNGGGWSVYSGNATYPLSIQIDTLASWQAGKTNADGTARAAVPLIMPESVARMVGLNPLVIEITNTGVSGVTANGTMYININANNIADGVSGAYMSVYVAGLVGVHAYSSGTPNVIYNQVSASSQGGLTFMPIVAGGKVLTAGTTITQMGFDVNPVGTKAYVIAPMINFGSWSEYNPYTHPAALDPVRQTQGLMQANRSFVTASGAATTPITIADLLVEINATAAAATATLPSAPFDGQFHRIKKSDTSANTVTVNGNGKLIDGASTFVISGGARGSVSLQYVGAAATPHWCVV